MTTHATLNSRPTSRLWRESGQGTPENYPCHLTTDQRYPDIAADLVELRRVSGWHCGTVAHLLAEGKPDQARARLDQLTAAYLHHTR